MVTMADVARRAGVSVTTVSHALNRTRYVAPATMELIQRTVLEIGYRQNQTARSLATSTSTTVGMAMSITSNPYFAGLAHQVEARLRSEAFSLLLGNTDDSQELAIQVLNDLHSRQAAGIIVAPLEGDEEFQQEILRLRELGVAIVFIDRPSSLPFDQVYSDNRNTVRELVNHLAEAGHRRIGYITGTGSSMTAREREVSYHEAVAELDLDRSRDLLLHGESDETVAYRVAHAHLTSRDPASAIVVGNNQMALGALRAIRDLDVQIPGDIAVVSFDDFEAADLLQPGLTVARQDIEQMALTAVELLMERIAHPGGELREVVLPTTFVHRESCGC